MIIRSKSGTGKTLVYAIVAAEIAIGAFETCAALILSPTRELAVQIAACVKGLVEEVGADVELFIGGRSERKDVARLTGRMPAIVVGTPGRVLTLIEQGVLEIEGVKLLVLDEADRLIDGSLGDAVPSICARLGAKKQTLAFSATFPLKLEHLLMRVMRKPKYVHVGEGDEVYRRAILLGVRQRKVKVGREEGGLEWKIQLLRDLLQFNPFSFCVVFLNEKKYGAHVAGRLSENGISTAWINADIPQSQRMAVMESAKNGTVQMLVTTDLLARGVDIETCDLVVHLDLPLDPATYLHRVGRAGRFGRLGLSVVIYSGGEEKADVERLETLLGFRLRQLDIGVSGEVLGGIRINEGNIEGHTVQEVPNTKNKEQEEYKIRNVTDGADMSGEMMIEVSDRPLIREELIENEKKGAEKERNNRFTRAYNDGTDNDHAKESEFDGRVDRAKNDHDIVMGECYDHFDLFGENENINLTDSRNHYVNTAEVYPDGAEGLKPDERVAAMGSKMIAGKEGAPGEGSDEAWNDFAKRAYEKGYKEGYERAYRMAKALGSRLGWGEG